MLAGEHQKRYENTEKLINEEIFEVNKTEHRDWLSVIMFYGAVHIIEKQLALRQTPYHSTGHDDRNKETRKLKVGHKLVSNYLLLYNAGLDARYYNIYLTLEEINDLRNSYNTIKGILGA